MLRSIKKDFEGKHYTHQAKSVTHYNAGLLSAIREAVAQKNPNAAGSIRSVIESSSAIVIRAASHSALSELFTARLTIQKVLKERGLDSRRVRFTV
ncbi:MAG: hypothetical protein HY220_01410 [Candidatus Sungbacteria bacterium]|uniref:Uncharacterized protein n=1 Tax=Candidatus Sungiibacteriota bacterium TaxID=2750080 RepID=A0A9D6LTI5_9BACT|nr:hypothetical protein [Candidatus Sungbacteria bacterium]